VSDGTGFVYDHTLEELKKLDFGVKHGERFKGMKILTFEEILQKLSCHVIMNIHLKTLEEAGVKDIECPYDRKVLEKIIALIDKYDCRKYCYFMCVSDYVLNMARELAPDIGRCVGFNGHPETMVDRAIEYECKKIQLFKPYFDQAMIDRAHENGILCNVFWSDDPEETVKFLDMGIDTILSNDYNAISQVVAEYKKNK